MRQPTHGGMMHQGAGMGQVVNPPTAMPNSLWQRTMQMQSGAGAGMGNTMQGLSNNMLQSRASQLSAMGQQQQPWDLDHSYADSIIAAAIAANGGGAGQQSQQQLYNSLDAMESMYQATRRPSFGGGNQMGGANQLQNMLSGGLSGQGGGFGGAGGAGLQGSWMNQSAMTTQGMFGERSNLGLGGGQDPYGEMMMQQGALNSMEMMQQQQQLMQQQQMQLPHHMGMGKRRSNSIGSQEEYPGAVRRRPSLGHGGMYGQPDYSRMGAGMMSAQALMAGDGERIVKRKEAKKKRAKTFPEKLMHAMMEHSSEDAVAWLPDGKSFVIVSANLFVDTVLNKVFKEAKYASFVRKLHRWGFVRLTSGTGTDCFHHPLFQRNRRDLASRITCTPRDKDGNVKGAGRHDKPPSLAGVEKFIRAKAAAAAAVASTKLGPDSVPDVTKPPMALPPPVQKNETVV